MTILDFFEIDFWSWLGAITGVVCVWLAAKGHILTWLFGFISALVYYYLFWKLKFYSDAMLQLLFAGMQIYGFAIWYRKDSLPRKLIRNGGFRVWIFAICVLLLLWPAWYFGLISIKPDAELPVWDSLTTVLSLIAVVLQARKEILCWVIWIIADTIYLPMYVSKNLYLTTVLYAIFLVLAVYGFLGWKRQIRLNPMQPERAVHDKYP